MNAQEIFNRFLQIDKECIILKQLTFYKHYILNEKKIKADTADIKLRRVGIFLLYLQELEEKGITGDVTETAFVYIRDSHFTDIDNREGTYNYRKQIFNDIREGYNYIYDKTENICINKLSKEQEEILKEVSKNNWYKCGGKSLEPNVNDSVQTQLIEQLGLKIYFDENERPYVLSHETAELLNKRSADVLRDLRIINEDLHKRNLAFMSKGTDFTMVEDFYEVEINNGAKVKKTTFRVYKDLIISYIIGLSPRKLDSNYDNIMNFKYMYIDAFNFIEEEYNKSLEKIAKMTEAYKKFIEQIRLENYNLIKNKLNN